jgi:hypothetical protein
MAAETRSQDQMKGKKQLDGAIPAPSQQGRSGGLTAEDVGTKDEQKLAEGRQGVTRVGKKEKLANNAGAKRRQGTH